MAREPRPEGGVGSARPGYAVFMADPSPALPPVEHEPERRAASGPDAPAEAAAQGALPESRASWGSTIAALGVMMILAGVLLLAFPFLLDFVADGAAASMMVCGGITLFLGVLRLVGVRHPAVGVAAMLVGLWLFASSFFVAELAEEAWSARSLGAVVFFLGLVGLTRPTPDPAVEAPTSDLR
jgi:hypothetical protein